MNDSPTYRVAPCLRYHPSRDLEGMLFRRAVLLVFFSFDYYLVAKDVCESSRTLIT
jgi:hypothetical protein